MATALQHKDCGNAAFKAGDNAGAAAAYAVGIGVLDAWEAATKKAKADSDADSDDGSVDAYAEAGGADAREVAVSLHLNQAMALVKQEKWEDAIAASGRALKLQPENVKALYRRGLARSRVDALDGANADLRKALKIEPANRDAKRELGRLAERLKSKRVEEKRRFSGGLKRATEAGLYGDKETERKEKKKAEAALEAKKRARHASANAARKEKGEESVTYAAWEAEEKKAADKRDEARKAARRKEEAARDEARRLARVASGEDRVVVDDEADLGCAKGYKTLPNGRRTSYFTNVPDQTTADLLKSQQAPKKIDASDAADAVACDGSAWNAAGTTFEERDTKAWVDEALKRHLRTVSAASSQKAGVPKCALAVTTVKKLTGEASIVVSRGRARHIFEYAAELSFEASFAAETPPGPGAATVRGALHLPEVSSCVSSGAYESSVTRRPTPKLSRPREAAFEDAIEDLKRNANAAVADFVAEYSKKKLK